MCTFPPPHAGCTATNPRTCRRCLRIASPRTRASCLRYISLSDTDEDLGLVHPLGSKQYRLIQTKLLSIQTKPTRTPSGSEWSNSATNHHAKQVVAVITTTVIPFASQLCESWKLETLSTVTPNITRQESTLIVKP
ncbi:hypothetical protein V8G54_017944 [Vigna mungo]|uniref:Uncharacterized protein n=1 Tax=Vigna mungo TaxID=3915 RepID=A0AAQ3N7U4_VIGMU